MTCLSTANPWRFCDEIRPQNQPLAEGLTALAFGSARNIWKPTPARVLKGRPMTYALDHLTILSRSPEQAAAFYGFLLPRIGFTQKQPHIWANAAGLYIQFGKAKQGTGDYGRYAPGLNHFGLSAPSADAVRALAAELEDAGFEARLQTFDPGITALFVPDPDGLRVEISYYPPGVPPVD